MPATFHHRMLSPRLAGLAAAAVVAAVLTLTPSSRAGAVAVNDNCTGRQHGPGGVKILATQDGQVIVGSESDDVLDAAGHLGVTIDGNGGDDTICGGPGNDVLDGGADLDWIDGLAGDDVIRGGDGDDFLHGYAGDDQVFGDGGDDAIFVSNTGPGQIRQRSTDSDIADGGDGRDQLLVDAKLGGAAWMTVDAAAGTATVPRGLGIHFAGFESYAGPGRHATFLGTPADDTLYGGFSVARLGRGDDFDEIGPGDEVRAGAGDDQAYALDGGTFHGGAGNDSLQLTFDEEMTKPDGATRFDGGAGDDTFGIESLYAPGRSWGHDAVDGHVKGGPGLDTIDLKRLHWPLRADLGERTATWDESRLVWSHVEAFAGSVRADRIRGSAGDDVIGGAGGPDVIYGLGGDDALTGGGSRDVVWGGPGHDTCRAEVRHLCEAP